MWLSTPAQLHQLTETKTMSQAQIEIEQAQAGWENGHAILIRDLLEGSRANNAAYAHVIKGGEATDEDTFQAALRWLAVNRELINAFKRGFEINNQTFYGLLNAEEIHRAATAAWEANADAEDDVGEESR
jgi:hypothetical protein